MYFKNLLKNKIQLSTSNFGDLIGFIKQFMNQTEPHLATKKALGGEVVQIEGFYRKRSCRR